MRMDKELTCEPCFLSKDSKEWSWTGQKDKYVAPGPQGCLVRVSRHDPLGPCLGTTANTGYGFQPTHYQPFIHISSK